MGGTSVESDNSMKKILVITILNCALLVFNIFERVDLKNETIGFRAELNRKLTPWPAAIGGTPETIAPSTHAFVQVAQRYASIGAGDLRAIEAYDNAAFLTFDHALVLVPLEEHRIRDFKP